MRFEYDEHPGIAYWNGILRKLPETTGKSVEDWLAIIRTFPETDTKSIKALLQREFALGSTTALAIAESYPDGRYDYFPETHVECMFAKKPDLVPLYEEIYRLARSLGPDVRVCPGATIVPFYRKHVFAQVKPSTRKRIDLGLALGDTSADGRLISTNGFAKKDRITHRIEVDSLGALDGEVRRWLQVAYERDR